LVIAQNKKVTDIFAVIESFKPAFLGFTCMTGIHIEALDLAKRLKEAGVQAPTILEGHTRHCFMKI